MRICPVCCKREIAADDIRCQVCRDFVSEYIETGMIERRSVPMVADVLLVMRELDVDQDRAVTALGGQP